MLEALLLAAVAAPAAQTAPPPARSARTVRLAPLQMFRLAEQASLRGDEETAAKVLTALSSNSDPNVRAEARFRRARQLVGQGRRSAAAVLLRRVLDEKPQATAVRLQLAQILQDLGDADGALRELRSAQATGLPTDVARLVDRYSQAIRATRPTGISVEVALAPDSNINRATRSDTLGTVIGDFDIDEDSKAKSGTGLALRGQAYRRFETPVGGATVLARVSGSSDLYRQKAYNDFALDLAVGPELQIGPGRLVAEAGITQRWFGHKPFVRSARLGATYALPLGSRTRARVSGSASAIDNRRNDLQDGRAYSGKLEVERALSATTGIAGYLGYDRQALKDPGYSTRGYRAGLLGWRDLGRATVTLGASFGRLKADERLVLFPEKRRDRYSSVSLGATFRQFQLGGFAPLVRVTVERNASTLEFHDYRRTRTEFGVARAF